MRYFFHVRDDAGLIPDGEGGEFSSLKAAWNEAAASAREFAVDDLRCGAPVRPLSIEITDEHGRILKTITIRDVLIAG
jgi:hypothetical protein